ncbi:MAG: hypothetical protein HYY51_04210 [Candidatus Magasanikbacteria bacterium]|nr:hypothetical protein [Candidatus Magasanikbacteria bacterium]
MPQETTKVQAVTGAKLAVASAFLGAAALAASAAGGAFAKPDLVIKDLIYQVGQEQDTVSVEFANIGKTQVKGRYALFLYSKPSAELAKKVTTLSTQPGSFQLKPGQSGKVDIVLEKIYQEDAAENQLIAYIDYKEKDPKGYILELNEKNNNYGVPFAKFGLSSKPVGPTESGTIEITEPVFKDSNFCSVPAALDPGICKKRLVSATKLDEGAIDTLLQNHQCAGVYKGFPIISDPQGYAALNVNLYDNVPGPVYLANCSLVNSNFAKTPEIVKACLDELTSEIKGKDLYLGESTCPDLAGFCEASGKGFCANRFKAAGLETQAQYMLDTYGCEGVYKGMPIIKNGALYQTVSYDNTADLILGQQFSGCSLNPDSFANAKACVDELSASLEQNIFFLGLSQCYKEKEFCATSAANKADICFKRLSSVQGLSKNSWQNLVNSYECADVYRGMVTFKVGQDAYAVLDWNPYDNFVSTQTLAGCSLTTNGPYAGSPDAARTCINQMAKSLEGKDPMFINSEICAPDACALKASEASESFALCQNEKLPYVCFDQSGSFFTCTNFAIGCGDGLACKAF